VSGFSRTVVQKRTNSRSESSSERGGAIVANFFDGSNKLVRLGVSGGGCMRKQWFAVISVAAALASSVPIAAKVPITAKQGHGHGKAKIARPLAEQAVVIDRDGHRRIVTQYFSRESLPPGLANRRSLPPGLQKQLRERGRLPPGLQKRLVPVPGPLVSRLPRVPPYYHRYFAGRDLVVVDGRTNAVVAVIPDVMASRR